MFIVPKVHYVTAAGDALDDIAVGAPFHADFTADRPEIGRVTVFHQTERNLVLGFRNKTTLTGESHQLKPHSPVSHTH